MQQGPNIQYDNPLLVRYTHVRPLTPPSTPKLSNPTSAPPPPPPAPPLLQFLSNVVQANLGILKLSMLAGLAAAVVSVSVVYSKPVPASTSNPSLLGGNQTASIGPIPTFTASGTATYSSWPSTSATASYSAWPSTSGIASYSASPSATYSVSATTTYSAFASQSASVSASASVTAT